MKPPARPALALSLQQPDGRHRALLARARVARWVRAALDVPAELTVRIVDEAEGRRLNREFRGRDYATDVLTFAYAQAPLVQADLVLCAPVVERDAAALGLPLADHYAHLLVHATLHAQGWDHERGGLPARRMQARERALLHALGLHDPYPPNPARPARSRRAASSA